MGLLQCELLFGFVFCPVGSLHHTSIPSILWIGKEMNEENAFQGKKDCKGI